MNGAWRWGLLRIGLGICALTWWALPGMGLIDLTVTWDPDWQVMLEAGWGMLFTAGLGLPFAVAALRPRLAGAALAQLYVVTICLLLGIAVGLEPQAWWVLAMLVVEMPLLRAAVCAPLPTRGRPGLPLLVLGIAAAPPALYYAWDMARLNRANLTWMSDITNGVDHFSVQAATGLSVVALALVASCWRGTRRLLGTSAALIAGYLGLVSVAWPGQDAGVGTAWSVAVLAWAAAVLAASWWPVRNGATALGSQTDKEAAGGGVSASAGAPARPASPSR